MILCVYVLLLYRIYAHVLLGILETILCVYVCVCVEGMKTCKTGNYGNKPFCLCLFCYRGYVHM